MRRVALRPHSAHAGRVIGRCMKLGTLAPAWSRQSVLIKSTSGPAQSPYRARRSVTITHLRVRPYRTKLTTASPNGSWHKLLRISICIDLRIEGGGGCSREFEGRYRMSIIDASTRRWRLSSLKHLESAGDRRWRRSNDESNYATPKSAWHRPDKSRACHSHRRRNVCARMRAAMLARVLRRSCIGVVVRHRGRLPLHHAR